MNNNPARVIWEGSFFVDNSPAIINREVARRLAACNDIELSLRHYERDEFGPERDPVHLDIIAKRTEAHLSRPADVYIRHQWAPRFVPPQYGKWIIFQPWEFGSIYREWLLYFRHMADEIWTCSAYTAECYAGDGIPKERLRIIPIGVNPQIFYPALKPAEPVWTSSSSSKFKFLFTGGLIYRKGADILLEAYGRAFKKSDDVCLVIKGRGQLKAETNLKAYEKIKQMQSNSNSPEIVLCDTLIEHNRMAELYRECDCLVHPYRGISYGLCVAEAMACGLPVIITRGGACDHFTTEDTVYYLNKTVRQGLNLDRITVREPWFIEPDIDELAGTMRQVYEQRKQASEKGLKASEHVRKNFTWDNTANIVADALRKHAQGSPVRHFYPVGAHEVPAKETFERAEELIEAEDYKRASHLYLDLLKKYPERFEIPAGLGLVAWYEGRYEEAHRWLADAIRLNPTDEDSLFNFCDASLKLGQPQTAEYALRRALSLKPALYETGRYLERLNQERMKGSAAQFEKVVAFREIIRKGEILLREGVVDKAYEAFKAVLDEDSTDFEALNDMGLIFYYARDYQAAYEWFIKCLDNAPTYEDALVNLFDTALKLHKVEDIVPHLRKAVQTRPELSDTSSLLSEIERRGDLIYEVANFDNIDPLEEIFRRGVAFLESGQLGQATLCFLDVLDRRPNHDRAYNGLGVVAFYRENYNDAYALFHKAVELNPLNNDALLNWYDAAKKLNRQFEVKPYLENLASVDSEAPGLQTALEEIGK